ncbi:hypothetical protein EDD15DRAFT_12489 [Pisolithus albus]|nr:hypothetical protein EDD15DRAFT_12489 [Pisolithus albus]
MPLVVHLRARKDRFTVRSILPQPTPCRKFVDEFPLYKLTKRHARWPSGRFRVHSFCTYTYYMRYSEDSLTLKLLVAAVWVLDTVHVSFMIHALYYYLIATYGIPTSLDFWSSMLLCASNILPLSSSSEVYYGVTPAVATIALAEIMITVSLCVLLYDRGSSSTVARTKRLLNTLIIYAINRCLLTSVVVIVDLATAVDISVDIWSMGLSFIVGKLYANSLLASLNSREHLRSQSAGSLSDPRNGTVHFANLTKLVGEAESSADGTRSSDVSEVVVINTTTAFALEKTAASRTEGEV